MAAYQGELDRLAAQRSRTMDQPRTAAARDRDRDARSAATAPARMTTGTHCLRPETLALTTDGQTIQVSDLKPGMTLRGGGPSAIAKVAECERLVLRERDMVTLCYGPTQANHLTLTSNHAVAIVRSQDAHSQRLMSSPLAAADVRGDDRLRLPSEFLTRVASTEKRKLNTEVIEVVLVDRRSTIFVGEPHCELDMFVEVYGELAPPPPGNFVKHLRFNRADNFVEVFDAPELRLCQEAMTAKGFSANLRDNDVAGHDFGLGKAFVEPRLMPQVLATLRRSGTRTSQIDIYCSKNMEHAVLDVVRNRPGYRAHFLRGDTVLDLGRTMDLWLTEDDLELAGAAGEYLTVKRTFIQLQPVLDDAASAHTR